MTKSEAEQLEGPILVLCRDGKLGMLTHWWDSAGVTVSGEEQVREIPYSCLVDLGNGRLTETL